MKQIESSLKNGTFGQKIIYYKLLHTSKPSNNYFIFFHGTFGSSYSDIRYQQLAEKIIRKNMGNVFLYETSRRVYRRDTKMGFREYGKTFEGKTFNNELTDVLRLFKYFFNNLIRSKEKIHLYFMGFSSGGTISSYLISRYGKYIRHIFLFGSGVTVKNKNNTIRKTYPAQKEILTNFASYKGNISLFQGSKDVVVPMISARKIILMAHEAKLRELIILKGVDHTFRKINEQEKIEECNEYIFQLIESQVILDTTFSTKKSV